ncbi:MAG: DUF4132 domain-containing protein [Bacteroidota bacterium]
MLSFFHHIFNRKKPMLISSDTLKKYSDFEETTQLLCDLTVEAHKIDDEYFYKMKDNTVYQKLKQADHPTKALHTLNLLKILNTWDTRRAELERKHENRFIQEDDKVKRAANYLLTAILRTRIDFTSSQLLEVLELFEQWFKKVPGSYYTSSFLLPFIRQVEKLVKREGLCEELKAQLNTILHQKKLNDSNHFTYYIDEFKKIEKKIEEILFKASADSGEIQVFHLNKEDAFGQMVNDSVAVMRAEQRDSYYQLLRIASKINGSKPNKSFTKATKTIIDSIGKAAYKKQMQQWIRTLIQAENTTATHHSTYRGGTHSWQVVYFLTESNAKVAKGLIWTLVQFHDNTTLQLLGKLAIRAYKKIPNVGQAAGALGNACVWTLANSKGLQGVSQLARLRTKVQQRNTKKLIEKMLLSEAEKKGISIRTIEELALMDYDLQEGVKEIAFEDYTLKISVQSIGKVILEWIKPDGTIQKSVPAFVKKSAKLNGKLKRLKAETKQIQLDLTAQRDRLDRMFIQNCSWEYEHFKTYYLEHGLMYFISSSLIWIIKSEQNTVNAIWRNHRWENVAGEEFKEIDNRSVIQLWHPVDSTTEEVLAWRKRLEKLQVKQALKQAYREIYLLTDAETTTSTYSNRMAAHILKQHQFNALAALRNWKYQLVGNWDHGIYNQAAYLEIPEYGLQAEYFTDEVNANDSWTDSGIWQYISTDQVRFLKGIEVIRLLDVPKIVFSEVMRDVDLFVGVASVGNDPNWHDNGGLPQYRDYWESYSFGNLSEIAKTRKQILERLVPRLKIRTVAEIDGKFLKIKGKIRTYKIHIGSTNILMEPNDEYLCIVPSRDIKTKTDNVFLPFEGDRGLSIVLSKAFLLMDDDKITDPTITRQLKR